MPVRKKSNSNFVAKEPKQGWAFFEDTGQWRRTPQPWGAPKNHFPKELGDWVAVSKPAGWQPPRGTLSGESLLGAGDASLLMFAPEGDADASPDAGDDEGVNSPTGGHTKIGAGHKAQGYDEHGRYTGPGGGSVSLSDGTVRLHMADEPGAGEDEESGEETGAAEPEAEDEAGQEFAEEISRELEGVLVADSGRVMTDAGGGEPKTPSTITWKNDDPNKPDPRQDDVKPQMRETVENIRKNTPELDSINVNSGRRPDERTEEEKIAGKKIDPHADGRAVDINKVNGIPVRDLEKAQGTEAVRAREAAKNMEQQAKGDPNVNQVIGPDGGWNKVGRDKIEPIPPKENKELLDHHKDHYHINVYRR